MSAIVGVNNSNYLAYRKAFPEGRYNGAYYYAKEIEENIIPLVKTDRNWDCLGMRVTQHYDHSIIFLHHNLNFANTYKWINKYKDVILVASSWATYAAAQDAGHRVIYLPLSVDVSYVKQFRTKKTKGACYAGNRWKFKDVDLAKHVPDGVEFPPANLPREELLKFIAPYRECYCIGRCAIEAKILGCEVKVCDSRYPDPDYWEVIDNKNAAEILQRELNKIDNNK